MKIPSNKIKDIRAYMKGFLGELYDDRALSHFAFCIFESFADLSRDEVLLNPEKTVSESVLLKINKAIKQLKEEMPVEYITGKSNFYGLSLKVNKHVLIPRPETEELVNYLFTQIKDNKEEITILDAATGNGCIALALKSKLQNASLMGFDISEEAISIATQNAQLNNMDISFFIDDLLNFRNILSLSRLDIIVSNPPYVRESEKKMMQRNVLDYEPAQALFVEDQTPLKYYKSLAQLGRQLLKRNGLIYCEINEALGKETADVFSQYGYTSIEILKDINGKERIIKSEIDF